MLKKRVKQIVSLFTALSLGGSLLIGSTMTATAVENIQLGANGYASLHSYISAVPGYDDVFKVDMSIDLNTKIDPIDLVFVVDNSASMGYPEDLSPQLATLAQEYETLGEIPSQWPTAVANTLGASPYYMEEPTLGVWHPHPSFMGSGMSPLPQGAWKYGESFLNRLSAGSKSGMHAFDSKDSDYYKTNNGFRFEWMQDGLEEAISMLLDPTTNGSAKQNRIAVVGFGDGSTDPSGDTNAIQMQPGTGSPINGHMGTRWDRYIDYNWRGGSITPDAGHVWPDTTYFSKAKAEQLPLEGMAGHTLTYKDEITFVSGNINLPSATPLGKDAWVKSDGLQDLLGRIGRNIPNTTTYPKLVRRVEGTATASGLAAAYDILTADKRDNAKKYVFLLTDGVEQTSRGGTQPSGFSSDMDFTESIAISTNLQIEGVNMAGLGLLEENESLFDGSEFKPARISTAKGTNNTALTLANEIDYLKYVASQDGNEDYDGLAGEAHLLRILTPIKEGSPLLTRSPYTDLDINPPSGPDPGSNLYMKDYSGYPEYQAASGSSTYEDLVDERIQEADLSRLNYARVNKREDVIEVFREFAHSLTTLSEAKSDVALGEYFNIYQMPGKALFEATNGSSATGGGKSFAWNMPDVGASGGSYKLTFYVKLDAPADQADVWQSLFSSWILKFRDFNGNLVKKGFPQVYAQSSSTGEVEVEVDHRLRDVAPVVKKAQAAFTLAFSETPQNVKVTNLSAKLNANKKGATLQIEAKGDEDLYYQWFFRKAGDTEWTKIPGAISSVYNYSNMKAGEYFFRCGYRYASTGFSYSNEVSVTIGK